MPASSTALPALGGLSIEAVRAAASARQEPEWLVDQRVAAWEQAQSLTLPFWNRTDLRRLKLADVTPSPAPRGTLVQWDEALAARGVICMPLAQALHAHAELIRPWLGTAVEAGKHTFNGLNAALWQDGVLLYVPRNVAVDIPLRASYTLDDSGAALFHRSVIVLERGASAQLVEEFTSRDHTAAFASVASEIILGDGAELSYTSVQNFGRGVTVIGEQRALLGRDAGITWVSIALGSELQHIEAEADMRGDGAHITWTGATFGSERQHLVIVPTLRHQATGNESHMDFKTVVNGEAYSVFDGMIRIQAGSRGTSTRLEEHAIHLTRTARSDSIPGLMIDTNDVTKAGHASTSGQIDDEQLFYMMARGISRTDAIHMIVMGFFEPALDAIPVPELRDQIAAAIEARL